MSYTVEIIPGQKRKLLIEEDNQIISVCAYCRVSTDTGDQRNSLVAQTKFFEKEFARHANWIGKHVFYDKGISGTSLKKRDGFNRMIDAAKAGQYQLIITKDVSRFSRNVENAMSIIVELQHRGVYILFLSDEINTQRKEDREALTSAIRQAEGESLKLSNKVRWGQQESMISGVVFGRKEMFGYNIVRDGPDAKQHFEIIADEAAIVKRIFQMYANGQGTHKIAKQLEKEGVPTKRFKNGWSNTVILRILRNEKYVGDLLTGKTYTPDPLDHSKKTNRGESSKVFIPNHHPKEAIIDRELWDRVQELLKQNAISEEARLKHSNRFWCSGKIVCGECGNRFVSRKRPLKSGGQYKAWGCWSAQQRGTEKQLVLENGETKKVGCNSHAVNERVLQQGMFDIITDFIKPKFEIINQDLTTIYQKRIENDGLHTKDKIKDINQKIDEKKKIKVNLAIQNASGIIDTETYQAAVKKVDEEIAKLSDQLSKLSVFDNDAAEAESAYRHNIEQLNTILELKDDSFNEIIYRNVLDKIEVFNGNVLKYYFCFLSKPIIMQYKAIGRGDNFRSEFVLLDDNNQPILE